MTIGGIRTILAVAIEDQVARCRRIPHQTTKIHLFRESVRIHQEAEGRAENQVIHRPRLTEEGSLLAVVRTHPPEAVIPNSRSRQDIWADLELRRRRDPHLALLMLQKRKRYQRARSTSRAILP